MRLFVAVNLDAATRAAIDDALSAFPLANPPWRWSAPDTWHITLKFLGETPRESVATVCSALERVAASHAPFLFAPARFGGFPSLRAPRVLFYDGGEGREALVALARDVDAALVEAVGVEPEARRFHPHVTVARVKEALTTAEIAALSGVPALTAAPYRVTSIDLMQSRLGPRGATYSVVRACALGRPRG